MRTALDTVHKAHARALQRYRRLLERTQSASSAQLHALQAELRMLKQGGSPGVASAGGRMIGMGGDEDGVCTCGARNGKRGGYWAGFAPDPDTHSHRRRGNGGAEGDEDDDEDPDLLEALRGARGEFSERAVRRAIRGLSRDERMRLSVKFPSFDLIVDGRFEDVDACSGGSSRARCEKACENRGTVANGSAWCLHLHPHLPLVSYQHPTLLPY
jgi:hypothetical protein